MSGPDRRDSLRGVLFALAAFGVYATHDVIVKYLGGQYSPVQIVFSIVLFGFPFVSLILMQDSGQKSLKPVHPWWNTLRTVATVLTGITAFYAFATLPLAQTYALIFMSPLLITVLSIPVLGEQVGWRRWAAVFVGLAGVMIVLRPGSAELGLGHLAAMVSAFTNAVVAVIMRRIGNEENTPVLILHPMLGNFIFMGAGLWLVYTPMPLIDLAASAVVAVLSLVAMGLLIFAYRMAPAAIVAPMQYSQILWAVVYGYFLFDERIDTATALGSAVIIASGLFIVLREAQGSGSANTPVIRTRSRAGTPSAPRVSFLLGRRNGTEKAPRRG